MYEQSCPNVTYRDKINCILRKQDVRRNSGLVDYQDFCRYLTTNELEIGQTLEPGYTDILNKHQASDLIGDGWTIDVIVQFFKNL